MNIVAQLQELDKLIIEHTKPPVTIMLRNKLSIAIEQAEAHSEAVVKQDQTLARQIETIESLVKENSDIQRQFVELKAAIAQRQAQDSTLFGGAVNYPHLPGAEC